MKLAVQIIVWALIVNCAEGQPWQPEILWARNGDVPEAHFGASVFPLGDQNDDGFADWGVMSMGTWVGNELVGCRMQLFHGDTTPSQTPYMQLVADTTFNRFRGSSCGDLNGDGHTDWYILVRYNALPDSQMVNVYYGGTTDTTPDLSFWIPFGNGSTGVRPYGGHNGNRFDINGDGYDDLGVKRDDYPNSAHSFTVYYGGNPMDSDPDWIAHGYSGPPYDPSVIPYSFGDVNGDHITDLVSVTLDTVTYYPTARIYFGGADPDTIPDINLPGVYADYNGTLTSDLNGDGYADLVTGIFPGGEIYQGGPAMSDVPTWEVTFGCGSGPHHPVGVGDINGDGFQDLTIANQSCGRLALYLGYFWVNADPVWAVEDFQSPYNLIGTSGGYAVGDVNNDGTDDWAIGTHSDEAGGVPGRVVILAGDPDLQVGASDPRPEVPQSLEVSVYPNPFNTSTTIELEIPTGVERVVLTVTDLLGQQVTQDHMTLPSGTVRYPFDASGLASGIYLLQVSASPYNHAQKLVVLK